MSERNIDQLIGNRIRARRLQLGVSQESLGELCGITFQQIQKYEKGTNRVASSRLLEIARHLNTTTDYFLQGLEKAKAGGDADVMPTFLMSNDGITLVDALSRVKQDKRRTVIKALCALVEAF